MFWVASFILSLQNADPNISSRVDHCALHHATLPDPVDILTDVVTLHANAFLSLIRDKLPLSKVFIKNGSSFLYLLVNSIFTKVYLIKLCFES